MAETKVVNLKLLVDTQANKVLFAEAGKDFVDFLFHLTSLPLGTLVKLLNVKGMVGSLGSLYKSVESLSSDYFLTNVNKDSVLKPAAVSVPLLSLDDKPNVGSKRVYKCQNIDHYGYITDSYGAACPNGCVSQMTYEVKWAGTSGVASSSGGEKGYVKGVVTYMVMDDLEVKPMSTISGITLINKFHVKDISVLVEKEVQFGLKEGWAMLKASLETKAVLTAVFSESRCPALLNRPWDSIDPC